MLKCKKKVKEYVDKADDHVVKLIYSMLEADRENDWWNDLPKQVQKSVLRAEKELKDGKGISNDVIMKTYSK